MAGRWTVRGDRVQKCARCLLSRARRAYGDRVPLRDSIDELDVLIAELAELRQQLCRAELAGSPDDVLWDAEAGLRHVARRAEARAKLVRRAIELNQGRRSA